VVVPLLGPVPQPVLQGLGGNGPAEEEFVRVQLG